MVGFLQGGWYAMRTTAKIGCVGLGVTAASLAMAVVLSARQGPVESVTVFASALNNPRGMKFGPDGNLYVAEAGTGGETPNSVSCQGPFSYLAGNHARILRFDREGARTIVADNLPSAVDNFSGYWGAQDVAFIGRTLYALEDAGGCERGHPEFPTSVVRVNDDGSVTPVVDLAAYVAGHPVAQPDDEDFEVEGSWWNLIAEGGTLYTVNPNGGDFVKITPGGEVTRIVDMSASLGHMVPTALTYRGNFFIGNLNTFPISPGSSHVFKVTPAGQFTASGQFTAILGLAFDHRSRLYVLQASTTDGSFLGDPGEGSLVRVAANGTVEPILSGLDFPSALTIGPDDALYVTVNGIAPDANGTGQILRVVLNQ
jgi:hypothetical protein